MRTDAALDAVNRHPRHVVLFALTAGLLLGPLSRAATIVAALVATALVATATARRAAPVTDAPQRRPTPPTRDDVAAGPSLPRPWDSADADDDADVPSPAGTRSARATRESASRRLLPAIVAAGAVIAGAVLADVRMAAFDGGILARMHGRGVVGRAVVLEPFRERARGPAVARARLSDGMAAGEAAVLRVPAAAHPGPWPGVGEVVAIAGRVAPLGLYDAYQRRRGAAAAVEVARLRATGERRGGPAGFVDGVRRRAESGLSQGLPPPRAALLLGMVLGQDERLSESTRTDFERSGLAHVLAVSGQNVMLLATLVLAAGALTGLRLRARLILALALVALYVPLTGAGPSIQRAGVMGAAGLVAALAGSVTQRWYALGLAAAVTLAANPLASGEPGWQLSFAAVVALLALAPGLRGALARRLPGPVADVAAITVAATLGTAPLMALYFDQVSLAALPANLLAAAAIAPIMWLGMLAAAAAQVAPALAVPFNALNEPLLGFVEWVAATMAAAPLAVVPVDVGSPLALAAAYAALAAAALALRAAWRRSSAGEHARWSPRGADARAGDGSGWPGVLPASGAFGWSGGAPAGSGVGWPRGAPGSGRRAVAIGAAALVAVAVLIAAASTGEAPRPIRGELVVSFLDVGQGDATLLQTDRIAVLVDTGPPDGPIVQRLAEAGVERLDALVLTHAQTDHEGAALEVLREFPTRLVVNGGAGWPSQVQRGLDQAIRAARARRLDAHAGQVLTLAGLRLRILWPPPPPPGFEPTGDANNRAIVAHASVRDFDLLLPADAESNVTAALPLPEVEALKVAHHGSADDGLPALLERTKPAFAAIEVGRGNSYGHPAPSTLAALRVVGNVVRTDRDGTVRLRVRGGEMKVERTGRWRP